MAVSSTTGGLRTGVCLSTDRPQNPYNGQVIYETDTNRTLVWDNSAWVVVADPALVSFSGSAASVTGNLTGNVTGNVTGDVTGDLTGDVAASAVTIGGENVTPYTGRRNLLYNGAMQVAQRGASATSVTTTGYRTVDRWLVSVGSSGTWTESVENDAPSGSGFTKSFKQLVTSAVTSPSSGANHALVQRLEGQDLQHLKKGTSSAESLTLSFWVKSNVTGTYVVNLYDNDNTRIIGSAYTVNSSGTWEKKVITFAGDTTGAFGNDNNNSFQVEWWLMAGSTFTSGTVHSSWQTPVLGNYAAGQVNLFSTVNNYWQITGVQLEVGDKATPFEHRSYGEELALCERYFQCWRGTSTSFQVIGFGNGYTSTSIFPQIQTKRQMRAAPHTLTGSYCYLNDVTTSYVNTSATIEMSGPDGVRLNAIISGGGVQYRGYGFHTNNNTTSFFALSAEL